MKPAISRYASPDLQTALTAFAGDATGCGTGASRLYPEATARPRSPVNLTAYAFRYFLGDICVVLAHSLFVASKMRHLLPVCRQHPLVRYTTRPKWDPRAAAGAAEVNRSQ